MNLQIQHGSQLTFPWAVYCGGGTGFSGDMSWGQGDAQVVFPIITQGNLLHDFRLFQLLGYSKRLNDTLSRVQPFRCPLFYWMRAIRIASVQPKKLLEKQNFPYGGVFGEYQYAFLNIVFATLPYLCLEDTTLYSSVGGGLKPQRGEWERNCMFLEKHLDKPLTRKGGVLKFSAGPVGIIGVDVANETHLLTAMSNIRYTWYDVPEAYLMQGGFATKVHEARGKVNTTAFLGRRPGTLLFKEPEIKPKTLFVDPELITTGGGITVSQGADVVPRSYDVEFNWQFFDPLELETGASTFGWNLAPDPGSRKWYPIVYKTSGEPPFLPIEFRGVFGPAPV